MKKFSETMAFLKAWLAAPRRVSAVAPSSEALARAITAEVQPHTGPVLELGPGTGVFTREILARGVPETDLTVVEASPIFAEKLHKAFTHVRVLALDATCLEAAALYEGKPVSAVISGLPLLSMPKEDIRKVLAGSFHYLKDGGGFYQFTYGPKCPVPKDVLKSLNLEAKRMSYTVRNLPPASVYKISRYSAGR